MSQTGLPVDRKEAKGSNKLLRVESVGCSNLNEL